MIRTHQRNPYELDLERGHDPHALVLDMPWQDFLGELSGLSADGDNFHALLCSYVAQGDIHSAQMALQGMRGVLSAHYSRLQREMQEDARRADGEALAAEYAHALEQVR